MRQYFDRVCRVVIEGDNQLEIEDCRIKFELTKSLNAKENTGLIEIYNLTAETRSLITASNSLVRLFAGYRENKGLVEIGQGDIASVSHGRSQTETITKLYIAEGRIRTKIRPISLSYDSQVRLSDILRGIEEKSGFMVKCTGVDVNAATSNGYAVIGAIDLVLDELALNFDFSWSVQNGIILITGKYQTHGDQIMLLNAESGLILIPKALRRLPYTLTSSSEEQQVKQYRERHLELQEDQQQDTYFACSLLQPHLQIGDLIAIESRDLNGRFRIIKISHIGDTHGNDWYSNMEINAL